jgi:ribose transport system substrate-binding protein
VIVALAVALVAAGSASAQGKKTLVFVVNGASDFWKIAEAGVKKAQGELPKYSLQFKYPEQAAAAAQQRLMEDLVAAGAAGIMVSAVDPKNQTDDLNKLAAQTLIFTTDSDAPKSKRVAYIGSSNVDLGKSAGKLMLQALPQGGKCIGFVGLLGADNARERIEGVKETIKGSKVELIDVRGDEIDQGRAKRNVEDALAANPDIACLVGFYSYNTPRIYEVLKETGKLGKIKIIGFDEDPITLGGVKEGSIVGTVGLPRHEADGSLPGRQEGRDPEGRHHHRAGQGDRQVERRRLHDEPEEDDGQVSRHAARAPARRPA